MHLNPRSVFLAYLTFLRISLKFAIAKEVCVIFMDTLRWNGQSWKKMKIHKLKNLDTSF